MRFVPHGWVQVEKCGNMVFFSRERRTHGCGASAALSRRRKARRGTILAGRNELLQRLPEIVDVTGFRHGNHAKQRAPVIELVAIA